MLRGELFFTNLSHVQYAKSKNALGQKLENERVDRSHFCFGNMILVEDERFILFDGFYDCFVMGCLTAGKYLCRQNRDDFAFVEYSSLLFNCAKTVRAVKLACGFCCC